MMEAAVAFLFGLLIGSFLNVCIYRWPRDLSVVKPRSHCIACEKTIAWYDNVPVVSFVVLGGRCRYCQARISFRYPVVELATASLFCYWVWSCGVTLLAAKMCIFSAMMVALTFCDLEERILPDEFTLGGLVVGLVFSAFVPMPGMLDGVGIGVAILGLMGINVAPRLQPVIESVIGAAVPAFFLWGGGWLYQKVRHREGLGFGDVKLVAMVGAFLGLQSALFTMILGSVSGSILGSAYIKLFTKEDLNSYELPFGTFLGISGIIIALAGRWITG